MVDKPALKELFLGLGYDKVTTEEVEEGGEEDDAAARPPPKEEVTDYAGEGSLPCLQSHHCLATPTCAPRTPRQSAPLTSSTRAARGSSTCARC